VRDPDALNRWYGEHLGVVMLESRSYEDPGWFQERGETVFAGTRRLESSERVMTDRRTLR